jgi:hypothetical protein
MSALQAPGRCIRNSGAGLRARGIGLRHGTFLARASRCMLCGTSYICRCCVTRGPSRGPQPDHPLRVDPGCPMASILRDARGPRAGPALRHLGALCSRDAVRGDARWRGEIDQPAAPAPARGPRLPRADLDAGTGCRPAGAGSGGRLDRRGGSAWDDARSAGHSPVERRDRAGEAGGAVDARRCGHRRRPAGRRAALAAGGARPFGRRLCLCDVACADVVRRLALDAGLGPHPQSAPGDSGGVSPGW